MAIFSSDIVTSAISASITDTAVDVFVYDTSKDSDGGAWRKRTSHTSWYNETLNTATRGSRKEFPAVAVIVATASNVTIYDGDDPDLPMWMVFDGSTGWIGGATPGTLSAKNGILAVGGNATNQRLRLVYFLKDYCEDWATVSGGGRRASLGNFLERNSQSPTGRTLDSTIGIVDRTINDVAMTVLPNASIDDATGLPIPTIAVATDGGVSVIKDDGTIVNATGSGIYAYSKAITITEENYLWWLGDSYLTNDILRDSWAVSLDNFPSSDFTWNSSTDNMSAGSYYAVTTNGEAGEIKIGTGNTWAWNKQERNALGGPAGLAIHKPNIGSENNSLIAAITSDYNTGWMHGDIEGVFLSDTDTTNAAVTYSDDFSNNNNGWGFADNGSSTISGGNLVLEQNGNARAFDVDALNGVATGTKLVFTGTVSGSGTGTFIIDDDGTGAGVGGVTNYGSVTSTGSFNFTATKTASNRIRFFRTSGSNNYDINFINITTEYDRSVNAKGLSVYGTITKSAVATGADLVGYSGFSASNYLQQPYNSDLAPGTEAYSMSCWFKTGTSNGDQYIFDRNGGGNGSRNLLLIMNTSAGNANRLQWWHRDNFGNITDIQITDKIVTDNVWHQVVALNDGTNYRVYVDGEVSSVTSSLIRNVINDNDPPMFIGVRHTGGSTFMTGSMALFRYSKSAPTPEQIKKMYEDEKCLFHENAKATLYGSSDAVTALAYDEVTDQLHVGTSAGRSDFQGLRRINNTTDPVATAISAHDSLIIEQ